MGDFYQITSDDSDFIMLALQKMPFTVQKLQQKGYSPESITSLEINASLNDVEGHGYAPGSRGSYDEPDYGSMFEDGIEASISDIMITLEFAEVTDSEFEELLIPEEGNKDIYDMVTDIIESDESVQEDVLNEFEGNVRSRRADARAESRAASREARYDRMNDRY